jgi:hypothetical protein
VYYNEVRDFGFQDVVKNRDEILDGYTFIVRFQSQTHCGKRKAATLNRSDCRQTGTGGNKKLELKFYRL